jgi:hypothetical protein
MRGRKIYGRNLSTEEISAATGGALSTAFIKRVLRQDVGAFLRTRDEAFTRAWAAKDKFSYPGADGSLVAVRVLNKRGPNEPVREGDFAQILSNGNSVPWPEGPLALPVSAPGEPDPPPAEIWTTRRGRKVYSDDFHTWLNNQRIKRISFDVLARMLGSDFTGDRLSAAYSARSGTQAAYSKRPVAASGAALANDPLPTPLKDKSGAYTRDVREWILRRHDEGISDAGVSAASGNRLPKSSVSGFLKRELGLRVGSPEQALAQPWLPGQRFSYRGPDGSRVTVEAVHEHGANQPLRPGDFQQLVDGSGAVPWPGDLGQAPGS